MKNPVLFVLLGVAGLGLGAGFLAGRSARPPAASASADPVAADRSDRLSARGKGRRNRNEGPAKVSTIRSHDTLESLLAAPEDGLYGRMALWLMDASPDEIAAYWERRKAREKQNHDIKDLVMIAWTRVDPEGATSAVAGQGDEHYAWWAWACHDPEAALETAIRENPARIGNVAWGIGEFHPKWLRENFDRIPESGRGNALHGLLKWGEVDDAMATLEFLREQNRTPSRDFLRNFVRQDPREAYEWFAENGTTLTSYYGSQSDATTMMISELADSHPDFLEELIAQQPSGARKRAMEDAAFQSLLKLDPEAALEAALNVEAPRVGSGRVAEVGLRLARTDPDRGFEIARDLFERFPMALERGGRIVFPDGSSSSGGRDAAPQQLLSNLAALDPKRAMETFWSEPSEPGAQEGPGSGASLGMRTGPEPYRVIANDWAQNDLEGFAEWVGDRNDPSVTDQFAKTVWRQMQVEQRHEEAADWAMRTSPEAGRSTSIQNVIFGWHRSDPEGARRWLESADLPADETRFLQDFINRNP